MRTVYDVFMKLLDNREPLFPELFKSRANLFEHQFPCFAFFDPFIDALLNENLGERSRQNLIKALSRFDLELVFQIHDELVGIAPQDIADRHARRTVVHDDHRIA